jgi:hypothetical protein
VVSGSNAPLRTVSELVDGELCRIVGTIRTADDTPLRSRLGQLPCVYWDVREGLSDDPAESESQSFWLEDATGRVLVRSDRFAVEARAVRQKTLLSAVATDLRAVSDRLKDLKEAIVRSAGDDAAALHRERKHLAKVATLLCAIRAHARGRVHLAGSLRSQEKWIRANTHLASGGGPGAATTNLMVDRWETVLQEGHRVEIEGMVTTEPAPPEIARGASYREAATVRVIVGRDTHGVRVVGRGEHAPPSEEELHAMARDEDARELRPFLRRRSAERVRLTIGIASAASVVGAIVWWLLAR